MGGMKHNYDFNVSFMGLNQELLKKSKVEFKHNNSRVSSLPQFLEMFDKDRIDKFNICDECYASYYYDHWLDKYLAIDNNQMVLSLKPNKDTYLKHVGDITYKHLFTNALYMSYAQHDAFWGKKTQESGGQYSFELTLISMTEKNTKVVIETLTGNQHEAIEIIASIKESLRNTHKPVSHLPVARTASARV